MLTLRPCPALEERQELTLRGTSRVASAHCSSAGPGFELPGLPAPRLPCCAALVCVQFAEALRADSRALVRVEAHAVLGERPCSRTARRARGCGWLRRWSYPASWPRRWIRCTETGAPRPRWLELLREDDGGCAPLNRDSRPGRKVIGLEGLLRDVP